MQILLTVNTFNRKERNGNAKDPDEIMMDLMGQSQRNTRHAVACEEIETRMTQIELMGTDKCFFS